MAVVPLNYAAQTKADANGAASVTMGPPRATDSWVVGIIGLSGTAGPTGHATAKIYKNGLYLSGSMAGEFDTASGDPPIQLGPSDQLTVTWTGLAPSSTVTATVQGTLDTGGG